MAIPDFQTIMRPLLELALKEGEVTLQGAISSLADTFGLTAEERSEVLPSGFQAKFTNRVAWAATHLQKAALLERVGRGRYRIADRGRSVLNADPGPVTMAVLSRYPEYVAFKSGGKDQASARQAAEPSIVTPAEAMEEASQTIRRTVATELLDRIKAAPPAFFERLVVDLLVAMGYGGSRKDAGKALGRSGDGGIDGVVKEDQLGLDAIYLQAKRWDKPVGRPEVQMFAGSLDGVKATKGVFLTTSVFTQDARQFAASIGKRVVLIDGEELTGLMIDHGVGVITQATYLVTKVDSDFFEDA